MRELLRHRDFRLLLGAQTLSMAGDWSLLLVFGIWAKALTGSSGIAGATIFAMAAPALLAPLGAVVVDRVSRRPLIAAVSAASVLVVLSLWFVRGPEQVWLLLAVALWYGFSSGVLNAAVSALLQDLLPAARLGQANGAIATVRQGLRLVAPLLGAGLFATLGGAWVATLDAVTFVVSALLILAIRTPESRRDPSTEGFRRQVEAGARHVVATPVLRRYAIVTIVTIGGLGLTESAVFALVDALGRPATFISVLVSVQGAGAIVSGVLLTAVASRVRPVVVGAVGAATMTVALVLEMLGSLPAAFVGFVLMGTALPLVTVTTATLLQLHTPNPLMGRVSAAVDAATNAPYTLMIGLGALLVAVVPFGWLFGAAAVGTAVATLLAVRIARDPGSAPVDARRVRDLVRPRAARRRRAPARQARR